MIVVTHPDVAAGGADVNAGPAITPPLRAGALRTMRWPPCECASLPKGIGIPGPET